jgi:hypothetical protein
MLLEALAVWTAIGFVVFIFAAVEQELKGGGFQYDIWDFVVAVLAITLWPFALYIAKKDITAPWL